VAKHFDADQDYDDFEAWFQELSDEQFGQMAIGWMLSVKPGTTLSRDGFDTFKGYLLDTRWPEIREARECDRLSHLADAARLAA
jgi:hypothetical protein